MYLPSLGFCFLLGAVIQHFWKNISWRPLVGCVVVAILVFFAVTTHQRIATWKNCYTLWGEVVKRYPRHIMGLKEKSKCVFNDEFYNTCKEEVDRDIFLLAGATKEEFFRVFGGSSTDKIAAARKIISYKLIKELLRIAPKDSEGYEFMGLHFIGLKQYTKAMVFLEKAVKLNPYVGSHLYHRGLVFHYLGEDEKATQDYYMAIRWDRSLQHAYLNLAKIHFDRKEYGPALICVAAALEIKANWPEAYELGFAIALYKKDGALCDAFSKGLVSLFPGRKTAHVARAIYLNAINDCKGAYVEAQAAIRLGYSREDLKSDGIKERCLP